MRFGYKQEKGGKMNLILSQSAFTGIRRECLKYPLIESGGILVGIFDTENVIVPFVIGSGPFARRSLIKFQPDVKWQQKRLNRLFKKYKINYVGSFHRHPSNLYTPSSTDYHAAVQILSDPDWAVNASVFPIILVQDKSITIYPYYISRKRLQFDPMTMMVLPDDHPVIKVDSKAGEKK